MGKETAIINRIQPIEAINKCIIQFKKKTIPIFLRGHLIGFRLAKSIDSFD